MMQAASLISIGAAVGVMSNLLLTVFADVVNRVLLLTSLFLFGAFLNGLLLLGHSYVLLLGCASGLGVVAGVTPPVLYALIGDRFGAASFGTVRGLTVPLIAVVSVITIRFGGEVFDRTGGYGLMFTVFIAFQCVAAALIFGNRACSSAGTKRLARTA